MAVTTIQTIYTVRENTNSVWRGREKESERKRGKRAKKIE